MKRQAFLLGCAVVVLAVFAAWLTQNKLLFRSICEWTFYIALIISAALFVGPRAKSDKKPRDDVDKALDIFKARQSGLTPQEYSKRIANPFFADTNKKPGQKEGQKQYTQHAYSVLAFGLPNLLAVLIEYYFF